MAKNPGHLSATPVSDEGFVPGHGGSYVIDPGSGLPVLVERGGQPAAAASRRGFMSPAVLETVSTTGNPEPATEQPKE